MSGTAPHAHAHLLIAARTTPFRRRHAPGQLALFECTRITLREQAKDVIARRADFFSFEPVSRRISVWCLVPTSPSLSACPALLQILACLCTPPACLGHASSGVLAALPTLRGG